jgi:hypothetical protein
MLSNLQRQQQFRSLSRSWQPVALQRCGLTSTPLRWIRPPLHPFLRATR